ncbi:MAG: metallophosphoesterase family protein [Candidatus Lokiarchaeota archaeon]|nr:metallophosphoesterase family protein [Candidatus Lokiarchaeota archaeon]
MKLGILSDTHITNNSEKDKTTSLINQLNQAFKDVDEIIHAGDVSEEFFLEEIEGIARTRCVKGNLDNIENLEIFKKFSIGRYNIGVIHILPDNVEEFTKKHSLQILIFGHTHQPLIKGTDFNVLLLNPGSPTEPKAPIERPGFMKPIARPSVITLNIDDDDILSTFIINLKF